MKTTITVQNLKCDGCKSTITTKLSEIENILDLKIDVEASTIFFSYQSRKDLNNVIDILRKLGYPSVNDANSFTSIAKSFVSCATGKF